MDIDGLEVGDVSGDGTATAESFEIPPGSEYSVNVVRPRSHPPASFADAEGPPPAGAERYTTLAIATALSPPKSGSARPAPIAYVAEPPVGVERTPEEREIRHRERSRSTSIVEGTPYARVLRL